MACLDQWQLAAKSAFATSAASTIFARWPSGLPKALVLFMCLSACFCQMCVCVYVCVYLHMCMLTCSCGIFNEFACIDKLVFKHANQCFVHSYGPYSSVLIDWACV